MNTIFIRILKGSIFFLLSVLSFYCFSQTPLSLSDAIKNCLKNNYDIRIEERQKTIARNNNSWGAAGRYPNITLSMNINDQFTENNNPVSFFTGVVTNFNVFPRVNLQWILFDGFRVSTTKKRLELLEQQSLQNADIVVQNTLQALILAYYKILLEQERLNIFGKVLRYSRSRYQYSKIRKELGSSSYSALLTDESSYLSDSINLFNQRIAYRNNLKQINLLMNEEEIDKDYVFTDTLPEIFDSYEFEDLQNKMLETNADIKKEYITSLIAMNSVKTAQASRFPQISANVGYDFSFNLQDYSMANFVNNNRNIDSPIRSSRQNLLLGVGINFTLFNGGNIKRAIENAIVEGDIANMRLEKMKLSLTKDLSVNFEQYNIRKQLKNIYKRSSEVAAENLELMSEQYNTGTINSFEYRNIQNIYLLAALRDLQASFELVEIKINLMRLINGIIAKEPVN